MLLDFVCLNTIQTYTAESYFDFVLRLTTHLPRKVSLV